MDSITHIVLGAAIGEAIAGRSLGKKAMLLGAVAQSLPDIDFIASFWMDTAHDVNAHRGISHSLLFIGVVAPGLALGAQRWFRRSGIPYGRWLFFFSFQLFIHIFLDAFNAYGTGWFEPFSHYRLAFNVLFVADPLYSVWLGMTFIALLILRRNHPSRKYWVRFGLVFSTLYLGYCVVNKTRIDRRVSDNLRRQQIAYTRYLTTPTPLNDWLWYVVAEDSTGFHTGYTSIFDRDPHIDFHYFPRNDSLLALFREREDTKLLTRFSQGYYTVDEWKGGAGELSAGTADGMAGTAGQRNDTVVFNDLRFGQVKGWEDGNARFVFHYFLQYPGDNKVILQRGRFSGWDGGTFRAFIRRIGGN